MSTLIPGRFIESFDSIRFSPLGDDELAVARCEIEAALAILFGQQIVAPEFYTFDSLGYLEVATRILNSRPKTRPRLVPEGIWNPLIAALEPNFSSYQSVVSSCYLDMQFVLSSAPQIDRDEAARQSIGKAIESRNWVEASRTLRSIVDDGWQIEAIKQLSEYFDESAPALGDICVPRERSKFTVRDYARKLVEFSDEDIDNITEEDLREQIRHMQKLMNVLRSHDESFDVRGKLWREMDSILGAVDAALMREYVSSCYNRVLYDSVRATDGCLTTDTMRFADETADVTAAERVATHMEFIMHGGTGRLWLEEIDIWAEDLEERISTNISSRALWSEIWRILAERSWIESVTKLHQAKGDTHFEDAFEKHCKVLRELIGPLSYDSARRALIVRIAGATFRGVVNYALTLSISKSMHSVITYLAGKTGEYHVDTWAKGQRRKRWK